MSKNCQVCNAELIFKIGDVFTTESGKLYAEWGYCSNQDGAVYELEVCESCFMEAIMHLKSLKKINTMFEEDYESVDDDFGLNKEKTTF